MHSLYVPETNTDHLPLCISQLTHNNSGSASKPSQRYATSPSIPSSTPSSPPRSILTHSHHPDRLQQIRHRRRPQNPRLRPRAHARHQKQAERRVRRSSPPPITHPNPRHQHTNTIALTRYGALSSGLQTSNGATTPKTPTKNGPGTPKAAATPASRKRARKSPQKSVGVDEDDDDEERPAGKKAKAVTPAANGAKHEEVKSEPVADDGQGGEEEVSFF